jgi:hypothetical protein
MGPFYSIDIRVSSRSMGTVLLWAAMPGSFTNCVPHHPWCIQLAQFK